MPAPRVSVIMPFFNNASTLERAARSLLRQTVADLELILIDDGSSDDGYAVAGHIQDPRVRLHRLDRNGGVSAARNHGMAMMRGTFMALMDADDECPPDRLERTLLHLQAHPALGFCGGWALWDGWSRLPFILRKPCGPPAVRAFCLYDMPAQTGTLLFRADLLKGHDLRFDERLRYSEDFDFLVRCLRVADGDNVPAVLLRYIRNPAGAMAARGSGHVLHRLSLLREPLERLFPEGVDDATLRHHAAIGNGAGARTCDDLRRMRVWFETLDAANERRAVFDPEGLRAATANVWFRCCRNSAHLGFAAWRAWRGSPWRPFYRPALGETGSFAATWLLSRIFRNRRHAQGHFKGLSPEGSAP